MPRERQVGEGESRDGGIQRHVLKGLVSSGHKGSSPPCAAASAHLCHVVNLHHQSAPLLLWQAFQTTGQTPGHPPEGALMNLSHATASLFPCRFISQAKFYKTIII